MEQKGDKASEVTFDSIWKPHFESPGAALSQLGKDFNDWSSILTQNSISASYAIIAANWAVHGSAGNIMNNLAAKWSLGFVLAFLGINLFGSFLMSNMHYHQFLYAERNPARWESEWENSKGRRYWPYTKGIENLGVTIRYLKVFAPIASCMLFIFSLFT